MNFGQIYQSINAWEKLAAINMKPKVAFVILRYSKLVRSEFELVNTKREELIREIADVEKEQDVKLEPGTPELATFIEKFNEMLQCSSPLCQIDMKLEDAIEAVDEKDETLTVQDLAFLEPFFKDYVDPAAEKADE